MAYDAAVAAGVDNDLIDLFVAGALKHDASWYVEHGGFTRRAIAEMEDRAVGALMPRLDDLLEATEAGPYCQAPIVSDDTWSQFVESLPHYTGNASLSLIPEASQGVVTAAARARL